MNAKARSSILGSIVELLVVTGSCVDEEDGTLVMNADSVGAPIVSDEGVVGCVVQAEITSIIKNSADKATKSGFLTLCRLVVLNAVLRALMKRIIVDVRNRVIYYSLIPKSLWRFFGANKKLSRAQYSTKKRRKRQR